MGEYKIMIEVIQQNTDERKKETIQIFNEIQPLLDDGYSFTGALKKTGHPVYNYKCGWFKHLKEYALTQGYDYNKMRGRRKK